ncbi:MAG: MFS transporter [Oscillospiraceae bacterium]|nr:MFS transporter [Oscillospiraceae bacterium]
MPNLSEESRPKIRMILRQPVKWMRGDSLPEEKIRPWEQATHIVPNIFAGIRNGFTYNTMYLFQTVFGVNKKQETVAVVSKTLWDGINDPIIGSYMDSKNYSIAKHRLIYRVNVIVSTLLTLLPMFSFGMSPWQHVAMFIAVNVVMDVFGTAGTVSGAKIFAHATPYSSERGKLAWASGIGTTIHEMLVPIAMAIVGLREVLGWQEYSIYIFGAVIFSFPSLFLEMGPSLVRQRVPDAQKPQGETHKSFFAELRECFTIIRHNRYFLLDMGARFITVFTPGVSDNEFYRYCGVEEILNTGKGVLKGEFLLWFRDNIVSAPCNLIVPFAMPIIKKMGGPRNMQVLYQGISTVTSALKFAVGMRTPFGVLFSWVMEMINRTFGRVQMIAGNVIKYEMLDYVEWKTGRRSEGVSMAMEGLMKKIVIDNVDKTIGNLVLHALGFDPELYKQGKKQPALYLKWAPVLYLLVPAIDSFIVMLARIFYKYPAELHDRVEAELIVRRRLAQEAMEPELIEN